MRWAGHGVGSTKAYLSARNIPCALKMSDNICPVKFEAACNASYSKNEARRRGSHAGTIGETLLVRSAVMFLVKQFKFYLYS